MSVVFKLDEFELSLSKITKLLNTSNRQKERNGVETSPLNDTDEIRLAPEEPLLDLRRSITDEVVELVALVISLESIVYLSSDPDVLDRYVTICKDLYFIRKSLNLPYGASVILDSELKEMLFDDDFEQAG